MRKGAKNENRELRKQWRSNGQEPMISKISNFKKLNDEQIKKKKSI